jgi:drug/metabolite transporter (DMT)-like permease
VIRGAAGGVAFGLAASFAWAIYNVGVEIGRAQGFSSADLALLRYAGGAAVMAVLLAIMRANPFRGTTPPRLAVLIVVAGPPFAFVFNTGYALAPLAHAVVISPGMTMLTAAALSRFVSRAPIPPQQYAGMALLLLGLLLIGADQSTPQTPGTATWMGDLCFVVSGMLWGTFTWLMGHWRLEPARTTGLIALVSTALYLPLYLVVFEPAPLPFGLWAEQVVYQGALGGAFAIVFFVAAIARLGPAAAGIFPALVPPFAVLAAVPMAGVLPNGLQVAGLGAATLGLLVSLDPIGGALRRRFRGPDRATASR